MYYQTKQFIYARVFMDALLKTFNTIPAAKLILAPTLCLLKAPPAVQNPDVTLAQLAAVKADFSGYADGTPVLTDPVRSSPNAEAAIGSSTFVATTASPFVGENVVGYYLTDGTNLVGFEMFANGLLLPISEAGDYIQVDLILPGQLYQAST